jgi:hypothetical protein
MAARLNDPSMGTNRGSSARSGGHHAGLRSQPIACTTNRFDQIRAAHRAEGLAQALHVHVDRAFLDEDVVTPDTIEQLGSTVHTFGMGHQKVQQAELGRPELHFLGLVIDTPGHPACGGVEGQARELDGTVERVGGLPAQHGSNAGQQLLRREGLRQVVVGSSVEAGYLVGLVAASGQHDHRQLARARLLAPALGQAQAALPRQHPVEQHEIGQDAVDRSLGFVGRGRDRHLVACVTQIDRDELCNGSLVLHHQDSGHAHGSWRFFDISGWRPRRLPSDCGARRSP